MGKPIALPLLVLLASVSLAQTPPVRRTGCAGVSPKNISNEFNEIAGQALDAVESLEAAELKGKLFYEPIFENADLAVRKTKRRAGNEDEEKMATCLEGYKVVTEQYRITIELLNMNVSMNVDSRQEQEILAMDQRDQESLKRDIRQALMVSRENDKQKESQSEATTHAAQAQGYADCGFSKYVSLVSSSGAPSLITPNQLPPTATLVAKLQCGQELAIVGRSGSWLEVKTQNNEHGYVSQWFVSEKPLAAMPNYDGPLPTKKEQKAARHRIGIGMTVEQVHAAWGLPDRVNMRTRPRALRRS